ncbi:hypothetical protein ZTR_11077 [Talaromyces verruculosus]|nr:hypothetical protein ZTR_11077 [Talaromyces verruculosus]
MGMWYKRSEAQKRFSFFFSSASRAGAFGGSDTCVVSIVWFFVLPDFPEDVKWLTEEEREYVHAKLAKDSGKTGHRFKVGWSEVWSVLKDYKVIIAGFMYFGRIVPAYSYARIPFHSPYNLSLLILILSAVKTQLYSVPPWVAALVFSLIIAWSSDRLRFRLPFAIIPICLAIAGFAMLVTIHGNAHRAAEYGALFLVTYGVYSAIPVVICWFALNLGGHHRRSVGSAWQIGFGNIGGIIDTYSFLSRDAPYYRTGYIICISFCCL